jgi:TonB family protein
VPFRWAVKNAVVVIAFTVGVAAVADAQSRAGGDCRPPAYVQRAIRGAERVELVRLGPPGSCVSDPLGPDRSCFMDSPRAEAFPLMPEGVAHLGRMLANGDLACAATGGSTGSACLVGFDIDGSAGAVRVTLQLPAGAVRFEIPNGVRFDAALSPAGLREWRRLLAVAASGARRGPDELERDLAWESAPAPIVTAPVIQPAAASSPAFHPVVPDMPAEAVSKVSPAYPDIAREAGVDGTVKFSALVGADGRVHEVRVTRSIPMLDAAARDAVMQWVFRPGTRGGKAVDSWADVPVRFSLH